MNAVDFNENAAAPADGSGIFGLPFNRKNSAIVCVPVSWEATTSYGGGTSRGPETILRASQQVDLFDFDIQDPWRAGIYLAPESPKVRKMNSEARRLARKIIARGGVISGPYANTLRKQLGAVNVLGDRLNAWVESEVKALYAESKIPCIVGGDHSTPYGAFCATAKSIGSFGILHFDAHSDTRNAYEGFTWSHASIMRNALDRIPEISRLVQVGVRDFCKEEFEYCRDQQKNRVRTFYDRNLSDLRNAGVPFASIVEDIISALPERVWISFDIDGLDPRFCPSTGTPVPGGLDYNDAVSILVALARSGKRVVGFDLNEVAPNSTNPSDEWDGNVGARLLYKMCAVALVSQRKASMRLRPESGSSGS